MNMNVMYLQPPGNLVYAFVAIFLMIISTLSQIQLKNTTYYVENNLVNFIEAKLICEKNNSKLANFSDEKSLQAFVKKFTEFFYRSKLSPSFRARKNRNFGTNLHLCSYVVSLSDGLEQ